MERAHNLSDGAVSGFELQSDTRTAPLRHDLLCIHVQVVHCDLKAKNILLNKDHTMAKIGDVGLARIMAETHLSTASGFFGTFAYTAPEVLGRRRCDEKVPHSPCHPIVAGSSVILTQ